MMDLLLTFAFYAVVLTLLAIAIAGTQRVAWFCVELQDRLVEVAMQWPRLIIGIAFGVVAAVLINGWTWAMSAVTDKSYSEIGLQFLLGLAGGAAALVVLAIIGRLISRWKAR